MRVDCGDKKKQKNPIESCHKTSLLYELVICQTSSEDTLCALRESIGIALCTERSISSTESKTGRVLTSVDGNPAYEKKDMDKEKRAI